MFTKNEQFYSWGDRLIIQLAGILQFQWVELFHNALRVGGQAGSCFRS
jgi:hypothetical protein